jgi:hypothetical protein
MFIDGVEEDHDGIPFRQIPILHSRTSSLWASETGTIKRMYSNKFTKTYTWGEDLKVHEKDGKLFVYIDNKAKLNIETAIASAWSLNKDNKKYPIYKGVEGWSWTKKSGYESDETDDDDKVILEDETEEWKLLEENEEYMISSLGRIKNNKGEVCVPTYCRGKRIICIPKTCAVDVDYYMRRYFDIGSKRRTLPQRLKKLGKACLLGTSLIDFAKEQNIKNSTAWSYLYDLVQVANVSLCEKIADSYISDCTTRAVKTIFENECEYVFSRKANEYMNLINFILEDDEEWAENKYKYEEVRVLKSICEKLL